MCGGQGRRKSQMWSTGRIMPSSGVNGSHEKLQKVWHLHYNHIWAVFYCRHSCSRSRNSWKIQKWALRWLQANFKVLCKLHKKRKNKPPVNHEKGPEHNRCCLICEITERRGRIPWQSLEKLLALEQRQGRIRSAEEYRAWWNSGIEERWGRRWAFAGRNVWNSFFFFLLYHWNGRNTTPLSSDCSLINLRRNRWKNAHQSRFFYTACIRGR